MIDREQVDSQSLSFISVINYIELYVIQWQVWRAGERIGG